MLVKTVGTIQHPFMIKFFHHQDIVYLEEFIFSWFFFSYPLDSEDGSDSPIPPRSCPFPLILIHTFSVSPYKTNKNLKPELANWLRGKRVYHQLSDLNLIPRSHITDRKNWVLTIIVANYGYSNCPGSGDRSSSLPSPMFWVPKWRHKHAALYFNML